jgi:hypothetical protein
MHQFDGNDAVGQDNMLCFVDATKRAARKLFDDAIIVKLPANIIMRCCQRRFLSPQIFPLLQHTGKLPVCEWSLRRKYYK